MAMEMGDVIQETQSESRSNVYESPEVTFGTRLDLGDPTGEDYVELRVHDAGGGKVYAHRSICTEQLKLGGGGRATYELLEGYDGTEICGKVVIESKWKTNGVVFDENKRWKHQAIRDWKSKREGGDEEDLCNTAISPRLARRLIDYPII